MTLDFFHLVPLFLNLMLKYVYFIVSVKVLKDAGLYNYDIFADEMTNQSSDQKMDKAMQITQLRNRFKHVSMMMKNRQTMEADSLFVCQVRFYHYLKD
jgi:hypothetical protein